MASRARMRNGGDLGERILEAAIAQAHEVGWENVRLHRVADQLGMPLAEIARIYKDVNAIADAWFVRARDAMLEPMPEGFAGWPAKERLFHVMMRWFDALAVHRDVSRQMLASKAYPSHPHHWVPMIFSLSTLVHWMLDAARIKGTGPMRAMEEIGGTAIVLGTLAVWQRDDSPGFERTRAHLRRRLEAADRIMARVWGGRRPATGDGAEPGPAVP